MRAGSRATSRQRRPHRGAGRCSSPRAPLRLLACVSKGCERRPACQRSSQDRTRALSKAIIAAFPRSSDHPLKPHLPVVGCRSTMAVLAAFAIAAAPAAVLAQLSPDPVARQGTRAFKQREVPRPSTRSLEYRLSWGLSSIRAVGAYKRGLNGRGITVAMIETGLDASALGLLGSLSPASTDLIQRHSTRSVSDHGRQTAALLAGAFDGQGTVGLA
jgi:hypothetical protein